MALYSLIVLLAILAHSAAVTHTDCQLVVECLSYYAIFCYLIL